MIPLSYPAQKMARNPIDCSVPGCLCPRDGEATYLVGKLLQNVLGFFFPYDLSSVNLSAEMQALSSSCALEVLPCDTPLSGCTNLPGRDVRMKMPESIERTYLQVQTTSSILTFTHHPGYRWLLQLADSRLISL